MVKKKKSTKKKSPKNIPTLQIKEESDIALDFATKVYQKFEGIIKSIVLFGSSIKQTSVPGSDIDIIIIIDDISLKWDQELIAWYREELGKIVSANPYKKELHVNTVKLSTWWDDLMRGDPVVINVLRYGESLIDATGFFKPLKYLLLTGKIKSTPEAIHSLLQRAPTHLMRSKLAELNSIEGIYWCMVDAAQAALISAGATPPSPEHIPAELKQAFIDTGRLKVNFVSNFRDLHVLHKKIAHGEVKDLKGIEIDDWQEKTEDFLKEMTRLVKENIS